MRPFEEMDSQQGMILLCIKDKTNTLCFLRHHNSIFCPNSTLFGLSGNSSIIGK